MHNYTLFIDNCQEIEHILYCKGGGQYNYLRAALQNYEKQERNHLQADKWVRGQPQPFGQAKAQ